MSLRRNNFRLAYRNLRAARTRSFLTMFGIIIGVAASVLMVCIGEGVKHQISGQLGHYGKNVLVVQPAASGLSDSLAGLGRLNGTLLSQHDLTTVQQVAGVAQAVPLAVATGSMRGDHTVASPLIIATGATLPQLLHQSLQYGDFFDDTPNSNAVVLGADIAHRLFSDTAPLGQSVTWRGQQFLVAGVFSTFAAPPFSLEANFNNAVFIPYDTAQSLSGNVLGVYQILAQSTTVASLPRTTNNVRQSLVRAHGGAADVTVEPAAQATTASDQTVHLLTMLVTGIALIALLVGGVGIMDVMLVSVTERMHEIGLRKAIGATNRQIMRQFMAEAFLLSAGGAVIGLLLAAAGVGLLRVYTSLQPVLVWQMFAIAPLVAIAVGLFFGTVPALKAARKDPIEALRHE